MNEFPSNFPLQEFLDSDTAREKGIKNIPSEESIENLKKLAHVLQEIREFLGFPMVISSGYRTPELNRLVKGSATSVHVLGSAADWTCPKYGNPAKICNDLHKAGLVTKLGIDQLIEEGTWVHLGLPRKGKPPRYEVKTAFFDKNGNPSYVSGLKRV